MILFSLYYIILYYIILYYNYIILYYIILYYIIYSSIKVQQDLINDITLRVFKFKLIQIEDSMTWVSSIQAPTVLAPYAPAAGRDFVSTVPPGCWQGPSGWTSPVSARESWPQTGNGDVYGLTWFGWH